MLSFMDAYSRYNHIHMNSLNELKIKFYYESRIVLLSSDAQQFEKCWDSIPEASQQNV